ncbi:MAG: hypothetical protein QXV32_02440 [Conexivisphaerales archaeon]
MISVAGLAAVGAILGAGATAAVTGDASTAAQIVSNAIPHGLNVALAHVPTWTHAHQVLTQHLQMYAQNSSAGAASGTGLGFGLKKALLHFGH